MPPFLFNNPLLYELRAGNSDDPYIPKSDSRLIVNNQIILSELPDEFSGTSIANYNETKSNTNIASNQFYVNYLNGIASFNSSENGKAIIANYMGRGIIQIPGQRIYYTDPLNNVAGNFQDLATTINSIVPAEVSRSAAESARSSAESLRQSSEISRQSQEVTRLSNETTRQTQETARQSQEVTRQNAESIRSTAYNSSVMIYQDPVATFSAIATTYPNPQIGWVVVALDTGNYWRYSGASWVNIGNTNKAGLIVSSNQPSSTDIIWIDISS